MRCSTADSYEHCFTVATESEGKLFQLPHPFHGNYHVIPDVDCQSNLAVLVCEVVSGTGCKATIAKFVTVALDCCTSGAVWKAL